MSVYGGDGGASAPFRRGKRFERENLSLLLSLSHAHTGAEAAEGTNTGGKPKAAGGSLSATKSKAHRSKEELVEDARCFEIFTYAGGFNDGKLYALRV